MLTGPDEVIHVEVERWLVDFQAQLRAAQLKRQALSDHLGRRVRLVLAVTRTRRTRQLLGRMRAIDHALPRTSVEVNHAIENATPLTGDGLLFVHPPHRGI